MASEKRYNNVLAVIDERLIPNEEAKKARGEVFTPLPLVREMLFGLRKTAIESGRTEVWGVDDSGKCIDDDPTNRVGGIPLEVWRDPTTKWLDPANGIGNFPVVAFYMLDFQLGEHGPHEFKGDGNKRKRRKHIVENMLFMIELNKGNINTTRKIFEQIVPGAESNICCANSLMMTDAKLMSTFGVNRFAVVMGNPPYNENGSHQAGTTIWPAFITLYTTFLAPNGYIIFINGQGWREFANEEILELMKTMNLLLINILGKAFDAINFPVDYFLLQNSSIYKSTTIINNNLIQDVNIKHLKVIPNFCWDIFQRWSEHKLKQLTVIRSNDTSSTKKIFSPTKTTVYQYPIIMNINGDGHKIKYANVKHSLQNKIKVLTAFGSSLYPFIDAEGKYGISENVFAIICETREDAEIVKTYLENPLVKCLIECLKIGTYAIKNKLLSIMPDPREFKSSNIVENLLLTQKERVFLEECSIINDKKKRGAKTEKKKAAYASKKGGSRKYGRTRKARRFW